MSIEDVKKIRNAYEQMLKDGTAFKEVDMSMVVEPDVGIAQGSPLGDAINETPAPQKHIQPEVDDHTDYTAHDSYMRQRIDSLRSKMRGGSGTNEGVVMSSTKKELIALKKRVKEIEEALMLVMETHERLME